jgi:plastocyanin
VRRIVVVIAALAAVGVLAGCGSSSSSGSGSSGAYGKTSNSTSAPAATGTVADTFTARDFSYSPTSVQLTAGKAVTLKAVNDGAAKHNLTVKGLKVNVDLSPGSTKTVTVTPKAGTYEFHCEYHPTQMKGTITVG